MNNPILEKNLAAIKNYNPQLSKSIEDITALTNNFELVETDLKEPNLVFNGVPLHSQEGAEKEAKQILSSTRNTPSSMHVLFGFGLGYMFKEFCEQSKGVVIIYEQNLEILRATLEIVDFSQELSKKNVFVTSDMESFKNIFTKNYTYKANASFVILNSYKNLYGEQINEIFKQIEVITGTCLADYNSLRKKTAASVNMILDNLIYTLEETPVWDYKDIYKGKTALIISAGPSLDENIETIKKYRDKVVIFCVGTALRTLTNKGIQPDFMNALEMYDNSTLIEGIDTSNITTILEPYTFTAYHTMKAKNKLAYITDNTWANEVWAKLTDTKIAGYTTKGTVSYEAISSAQILGFTKIILVGQDLAYVNGQCYSKGSNYGDLIYEKNPKTGQIVVRPKDFDSYLKKLVPTDGRYDEYTTLVAARSRIANINNTLYFVKGISGEMLPTEGGYATFIEHFKAFALEHPELDLINTSLVGANIEGFKNIPLEEALKDLPKAEIKDLTKKTEYNLKDILLKLECEKQILDNIIKEIEPAKDIIYKFEREFNRRKTITDECNKYFKQLLTLYDKITSVHKTQSLTYTGIALAEDLEIQYRFKSSETVNIQSIMELSDALKTYFREIPPKLELTRNKLAQQAEMLGERINTKS